MRVGAFLRVLGSIPVQFPAHVRIDLPSLAPGAYRRLPQLNHHPLISSGPLVTHQAPSHSNYVNSPYIFSRHTRRTHFQIRACLFSSKKLPINREAYYTLFQFDQNKNLSPNSLLSCIRAFPESCKF